MSAIGHFAAGLAARPTTPRVPLIVLLAAGETNDILYFLFTAAGIETAARTSMSFTEGIRYLDATVNPWSHGLFMSVVWALLAAVLAFAVYRDRRSAGILGLVVLSHFGLDFLMHSNLPLFFEGSPRIGLGLENTGPGFVLMTLIDLALFTSAGVYYWRARRKKALARAGGLRPA